MSSLSKIIKYFAIGLACFLIVVIFQGIFMAGSIVSGVFFNNSNEGLNIDKYDNNMNILSVSLANASLIIKEGDTFKVELGDSKNIKVKQEHNKIAVREEKYSFLNKHNNEVIVFVPKDMLFDKVYISSGAGEFNLESLWCKDLTLDLGAGKVNVKDFSVTHKASIDAGTGDLNIKNANINDLDLELGVGKATLEVILTGESDIEAGIGQLDITLLDSKDNYTIRAEKGIGDLKINGDNYSDETKYGNGTNYIDIEGGIGSIDIRFAM